MTLRDRDLAEQLGRETVDIIRAGGYIAPSRAWVDMRASLSAARDGTVEYPPDKGVAPPAASDRATRFTVQNATVPDVGLRVVAKGRASGPLEKPHQPSHKK